MVANAMVAGAMVTGAVVVMRMHSFLCRCLQVFVVWAGLSIVLLMPRLRLTAQNATSG